MAFLVKIDSVSINDTTIDEGRILEDRSIAVTFENDLGVPVDITSIAITSGQGITLTGISVGYTIPASTAVPGTIEISDSASATFLGDVQILTDAGSGNTAEFAVTGFRVTEASVYMLDADWNGGLQMTRRFLTDVFSARSQAQERKQLRDRPVRELAAKVTFNNTHTVQQVWANMRRGTGEILFPFYPDRTDATSVTTSKITCTTEYRRFFDGGLVAVVQRSADRTATEYQIFVVDTVEFDGLTLDGSALDYTFAPGAAVYPLMTCIASLNTDQTAMTDWKGQMIVDGTEKYGRGQFPVENDTYVPTTRRGHSLLRFDHNTIRGTRIGMGINGVADDSGRGFISYTQGDPFQSQQYLLSATSRSEYWDVIGFINSLRGRAGLFWAEQPLNLLASSTGRLDSASYYEFYLPADVEISDLEGIKAVWLESADGTEVDVLATISVYYDGIGQQNVIKTEASFQITDFDNAIAKQALLMRQTTDDQKELWLTDGVVEVTFGAEEVVAAYPVGEPVPGYALEFTLDAIDGNDLEMVAPSLLDEDFQWFKDGSLVTDGKILDVSAQSTGNWSVRCFNWGQVTGINWFATDVSLVLTDWVLPSALQTLILQGTNTTGALTGYDLLSTLETFNVGDTPVSGVLTAWDLPAGLSVIEVGSTALTGSVAGWTLPTTLTYLGATGTSITGDVSVLSYTTAVTGLYLNVTGVSYGTGNGFDDLGDDVIIQMDSLGLDQAAVDRVLIDLVDSGAEDGTIFLETGNTYPSVVGQTAASVLTGRGWTVHVQAAPVTSDAYSFDGVDDYVDCGNDTSLQIRESITVSAWVNMTDPSDNEFIMCRDDVANRNWILSCGGLSGSQANFYVFINGGFKEVQTTTDLSAGAWYHLAATYDGAAVRIYVNGVQEEAKAQTGLMDNDPVPVVVGRRGDGTNYFSGQIFEPRIYASALDADDILDLYEGIEPPQTPVLHLSLPADGGYEYGDEMVDVRDDADGGPDQSSPVFDLSGNGNDGTPEGGVVRKDDGTSWTGIFDGVDDYVSVPSLGHYDTISVSTWVYVASHSPSNGEGLVSKWDSSTGREWLLYITSAGYAAFVIRDGADATKSVVDTTLFPIGSWHHEVGVADGSNIRLYIDGVLVAGPTTYNGVIFDRPTNLELGRYNDNNFCLDGQIAAPLISPTALSADDVALLYAAGRGADPYAVLPILPNGAVPADVLLDLSGNKNDGDVDGMSFDEDATSTYGDFDGVDDEVTIPTALPALTDFSVGTWFKLDTFGSNPDKRGLIVREPGTDTYDNFLSIFTDTGGDNHISFNAGQAGGAFLPDDLATATWYHVLLTYDDSLGSDQLNIYVDGVLEDTITVTTPPSADGDFLLGNYPYLGGKFLDGQMTGTFLSQSVIDATDALAIYTAGRGVAPSENTLATLEFEYEYKEGVGLSAFYDMEPRANSDLTVLPDTSSNGNDGAVVGMDFSQDGEGGYGIFDGVNDYANTGSTTLLHGADGITLSCWVRQDSFVANAGIIYTVGGPGGMGLRLSSSTGQLVFRVATSGGDMDITANGTGIDDGKWHHVLGRWQSVAANPLAQPAIYVDGTQVAIRTGGGLGTLEQDDYFYFGWSDNVSTYRYGGGIANGLIHNTALSASDVLSLYSAGRGADPATVLGISPVASYDFVPNAARNPGILKPTVATGPVWSASTRGADEGEYTFDGVDDLIRITEDDLFGADHAGAVSVWVRADGTNSVTMFCSSSQAAGANYYITFRLNGSGKIRHQQRNNDTASVLDGSVDIEDGAWHHVVVTSDGSTTSIYTDGTLNTITVVAGSNNGDWFANTSNRTDFAVGGYYASGSALQWWVGKISDPRIYNVALTAAEVLALYNGTDPATPPVLHYPMLAESWKVVDASGENNDGTAVGGVKIETAPLI